MKHCFKKILSVVLAVAMILSLASFAFAANNTDKTPIIIIPGIGQSETKVYDKDGSYIGDVSTLDLPGLEVGNILKWLLSPLVVSALTRSDIMLTKTIDGFVKDLFKPFARTNDGKDVYNKQVRQFNAPFSKLSAEERSIISGHIRINGLEAFDDVRYYFTYDSFGSIKEAAENFHTYLHDVVFAQTGASKVNLVPISQGGTILAEYLAMYPEDYSKIKKIINVIPAFDGSQILGDVMVDNVNIHDIDRLHKEILPSLIDGDLPYQISLAIRLVLSSDLQKKVLKSALEAVKDMMVVRSSMMWALCPSKEYAVAKENYLADKSLKPVLDECNFYDNARKALPNTLRTLMTDYGVTVHTISFYDVGLLMPKLFGSEKVNADELLTPASSGLGTTSANVGETLGKEYVCPHTFCNKPGHNHLSPDGVLDATTCALPENTWFFKNAAHSGANGREDVKNFAARLIVDDSITDIYTFDGYSQFIDPVEHTAYAEVSNGSTYYYDSEDNFLFRLDNPKPPAQPTFWSVLSKIVNSVCGFLGKLGNPIIDKFI